MSVATWLGDRLGRAVPERLPLLLRALVASGATPTHPTAAPDRMPLVLRLAHTAAGPVGLLVWPTPDPGTPVPVVRERGRRLELLAGSASEGIQLLLGELERGGALSDELKAEASPAFRVGDPTAAALPWDAWRVLHGGGPPGAYAALAERHEARGDLAAALASLERSALRHAGWAEAHALRAMVLQRAGRPVEARDAAVLALSLPVFTTLQPFEPLARLAGWAPPIDAAPYRRHATDPTRPPADRAAWWLDVVASGEGTWFDVRHDVAAAYDDAGLEGIASLVRAGASTSRAGHTS